MVPSPSNTKEPSLSDQVIEDINGVSVESSLQSAPTGISLSYSSSHHGIAIPNIETALALPASSPSSTFSSSKRFNSSLPHFTYNSDEDGANQGSSEEYSLQTSRASSIILSGIDTPPNPLFGPKNNAALEVRHQLAQTFTKKSSESLYLHPSKSSESLGKTIF